MFPVPSGTSTPTLRRASQAVWDSEQIPWAQPESGPGGRLEAGLSSSYQLGHPTPSLLADASETNVYWCGSL